MRSFDPGFLEKQPIPSALLSTVRLLGEFKGKQALFKQQSPRLLETLRQVAIIQSIESSNRLEGVVAPHERIVRLAEQKTSPQNRSEQEIAGYREVLRTIHANHENIPFSANVVLQLHRDLYQFLPGEGGRWKATNNDIVETRPDGTQFVRFEPVPAHLTPSAMEELHGRFEVAWNSERADPLLLIPTYVLDFLCIHPFRDGNGRMARLLALLLLYRAGYEVGRFVSLELLVERTREGYYDSLYRSSQGWHQGQHGLGPWWEYFLGVMLLTAYREFEERAGTVQTARGAKSQLVKDAVAHLGREFHYADVERACPGVSRPTINRMLAELRRENAIRCVKAGRDALWQKP